jgi:5-formyltetrahydrofolate cyclo-ligase
MVFVPRCRGMEMQMVRLQSFKDYESLPINSWGIPEPIWNEQMQTESDFGGLDLVIMPGVIFDKSRSRLGYGKGYE